MQESESEKAAPAAITGLAAIILPVVSGNGVIGMLAAYFDDSGTHGNSDVVLWAGLWGYPNQWEHFERLWAEKLSAPSPGKEPLHRFHMVECQNGGGAFAGWGRTATDFLAHELTQIIIRTMLSGCAVAISRKDWDEALTGTRRNAFGDAEGIALRNVYLQMTERLANRGASELALVFDERPHRTVDSRAVFNLFEADQKQHGRKPELVSVTFASATKLRPLQAADLFAWECHHHANAVIKGGRSTPVERATLRSLLSTKRITLGMADRGVVHQKSAALVGDDVHVDQIVSHMNELSRSAAT